MPLRPFALLGSRDQWVRAAHEGTHVDSRGVVSLDWTDPPPVDVDDAAPPPEPGGLAFDLECRLYRSLPLEGRVERMLWAATDPTATVLDLLSAPEPVFGEFHSSEPHRGALQQPRGLAVDCDDRLFVAESGARRVLVYDLWSRRLLRRLELTPLIPLDLATIGTVVYALTDSPAALFRLSARSAARSIGLPDAVSAPSRIAVSPNGLIAALQDACTDAATVIVLDTNPSDESTSEPTAHTRLTIPVPRATDLEFLTNGVLVVARLPGDDFRRFTITAAGFVAGTPLRARGYDGRGIVRTPDGRIAFWSASGVLHAVEARVRFVSRGRVTSFQLDSGEFQTRWGRLFLDACIPRNTDVRVHCVASDAPPVAPTLDRTPPSRFRETIRRPDLSPPMPAVASVAGADDVGSPLHRRETGRELPWSEVSPSDPFQTYEAPIRAEGRYLWVTLDLRGNTRHTPRIKSLRAEYPTHDYLRRLPRAFSRSEGAVSFLNRFLAPFEGVLGDLAARSSQRHALLSPTSAHTDILPWLAGFVGLVLDERWPTGVKRRMIDEAAWLFRFRGTVPGLKQFIEIYVGAPIILLEHFKLAGAGGVTLGGAGTASTTSVLGAGFRIGGAVGTPRETPLPLAPSEATRPAAHRFTVIIPAVLSEEQVAVVRHILEVHRPAHTAFDVCTAGAGMRVGRGLHVGLSSVIGRTGGFVPLQVGDAALGRTAVIGRPGPGTRPGASRLGRDNEVG